MLDLAEDDREEEQPQRHRNRPDRHAVRELDAFRDAHPDPLDVPHSGHAVDASPVRS